MTTAARGLCCFLLVLSLSPWGGEGRAASTAYVATTRHLDLRQVHMVLVAPREAKERLYARAASLFMSAGLPVPRTDKVSSHALATLTLTLDPQPIGATCAGKFLYVPSLTLSEPVVIPRNSVIKPDITWLMRRDPHILGRPDNSALDEDLDHLVGQFIEDYKTANTSRHRSLPDPASDEPRAPAGSSHSEPDIGLNKLPLKDLPLSVWATRSTAHLAARAALQLSQAGIAATLEKAGTAPVTLGIELLERSLDPDCPGMVLHEQGIYLVEQVHIQRNPEVVIWSDTWLRERLTIGPPTSLQRLEADQEALLAHFIAALPTR